MDRALAEFVEPDAVQGPSRVLARRRRLLPEGAQQPLAAIPDSEPDFSIVLGYAAGG
jgi:hypothetical protein